MLSIRSEMYQQIYPSWQVTSGVPGIDKQVVKYFEG